jgi:pilus assembly protein Flp/PilA
MAMACILLAGNNNGIESGAATNVYRPASVKRRHPMLQFVEALRGLYIADENEGQGLVEYALIIAFIAVVVIVAMVFLQGKITTLFSKVGNSLT